MQKTFRHTYLFQNTDVCSSLAPVDAKHTPPAPQLKGIDPVAISFG
jgi:hypothetical protein